MSSYELLTTAEVAVALGITRQAVADRVKAGKLTYARKSPGRNGAYLFDPAAVEDAPARWQRTDSEPSA